MAPIPETFWAQDCGARGPALRHTHGECIDPERKRHEECPCRHCGLTPSRWLYLLQHDLREAGVTPEEVAAVVDPDSLPLEMEQPGEQYCGWDHKSWSKSELDKTKSWPTCPNCNVPIEPKMATGEPIGPMWGSGRGWVSPRMKRRWSAVAHRAMLDAEQNLPPMSSYR